MPRAGLRSGPNDDAAFFQKECGVCSQGRFAAQRGASPLTTISGSARYLGLATEAARQAKQPVILGAVAQQLYQSMSQRGEGGQDFSAIINSYRKPK